jgi:hypothetical protein
MFCEIRDGVAVLRCGVHEPIRQYRELLGVIDRLTGYRPGMPILLDLRGSTTAICQDAVVRRVGALRMFVVAPRALRVGVVGGRPSRLIDPLETLPLDDIKATAFETSDAARLWLLSPAGVEEEGGERLPPSDAHANVIYPVP